MNCLYGKYEIRDIGYNYSYNFIRGNQITINKYEIKHIVIMIANYDIKPEFNFPSLIQKQLKQLHLCVDSIIHSLNVT